MFLFQNRATIIVYVVLWLLYAVMHAFSMSFIVPVSLGVILVDALIHAVLYAVLGVLIWIIFQYGNYSSFPFTQRLINYTAMALLAVSLWLSVGYLIEYILFEKYISLSFAVTLPVKGMLGLLLYIILILFLNIQNEPTIQSENTPTIIKKQTLNTESLERISVKTKQKLHIIPIGEILYIQSDGDYVQIITKDGKFLKEQTMKYFESHLPQTVFVRIHRSYLVNIAYISRIESDGKQNYQIILSNGQTLSASLSGYKALRMVLGL